MKQYDLSKKTLIPFLTHEGSGLGYAVQDIKKIYPDANILSPEALEKAIEEQGDRIKAVILNYPANPTGVTYLRSRCRSWLES